MSATDAQRDHYRCAECDRVFASEDAIRRHQNLYATLRKLDPAVDEHDGNPWTRTGSPVLVFDFDIVAEVVSAMTDLVFDDGSLLSRLPSSVRFLVLGLLTDDPNRAYEFNKRAIESLESDGEIVGSPSMFTSLHVNLNGEWPPDENKPEYIEIARWDGLDPAGVGDLVTIHGLGGGAVPAGMTTVRIDARRWGVQRSDRVRSLELYGHLVCFDGSEGSFFPDDVRRVARKELAATGHEPEVIDDVLASPTSGPARARPGS